MRRFFRLLRPFWTDSSGVESAREAEDSANQQLMAARGRRLEVHVAAGWARQTRQENHLTQLFDTMIRRNAR